MNTFGTNPLSGGNPVAPDTVGNAIISTAAAIVAQDWPTGGQLVHFNCTADSWVNLYSTGVTIPTTNSAGTTASSGLAVLLKAGHEHVYQVPGASTGYSITAATSGVVNIEFWRK